MFLAAQRVSNGSNAHDAMAVTLFMKAAACKLLCVLGLCYYLVLLKLLMEIWNEFYFDLLPSSHIHPTDRYTFYDSG